MKPIGLTRTQESQLKGSIGRRKSLFEQFESNPQRLHLSLEIKILDDQIAECNQNIRADRGRRQ